MKKNIIIFLAGLLLGAVISTASIYVYSVTCVNNNDNGGMQMQAPNGDNAGAGMQNGTNTPPEMPSDNANQTNTQSSN